MSSNIQAVSGLTCSAAQAADAKEAAKTQKSVEEAQGIPPKPVMDEYIPEEKQEPSGFYWLGRDEDGQPKIYADAPEKEAPEKKAETCTGSTAQVDHEIEALRKKKAELEQKLNSETDETKAQELEKELAQVERELSQKDNDAYRRQHTVFS